MASRGGGARGRGRGRGQSVVKQEPDAAPGAAPALASGSASEAPSSANAPAVPVKKFEPKVAPRRLKKAVEVKSEPAEVDAARIQKLIQDAQDAAANRRGFRSGDNKVASTRVAFGSGSGPATRVPAGFAKKNSSGGGGHGGGGGGGGGGGAWRGPDRKPSVDPQTGEVIGNDRVAKTRIGLLDSADDSSYKPISLPLRRPIGVGTEFSDDEGDEDGTDRALEEDVVAPAKELGLEAESADDRLLFLHLPSLLPASETPGTSLDKFPEGMMGKLRIYQSGAIKLQLGETVMNVYPGTRCVFSQEVVAINSSTKKCAFLGDVGQRLVVTPDIDGLLGSSASYETSNKKQVKIS